MSGYDQPRYYADSGLTGENDLLSFDADELAPPVLIEAEKAANRRRSYNEHDDCDAEREEARLAWEGMAE